MKTKIKDEKGNLLEIQDKGETVFSTQELKERIENVNGNPDMKQAMLMVVKYLESEG